MASLNTNTLLATKRCNKCGENKVASAFRIKTGLTAKGKGYLRSFCYDCEKIKYRLIAANPKNLENRRFRETKNRRSLTLEEKRSLRNKWKFGLSPEAFDAIYKTQRGNCGICSQYLDRLIEKKCFVDHDHVTGIVRGILCRNCNSGLGFFKDNKQALAQAIKYLKESKYNE